MSSHTPGPWHIYDSDIYSADDKAIADTWDFAIGLDEAKANMRLIAAAPMMLEALESVWLWMENQADGQSKGGHATFDLMMLREQRDIVRAAIAKATGGAA